MNDLPSTVLLQQSHARPKTGEELEVLGKQAAAKYAEGTNLTDAVVEVVKRAGLSPEQVRRVTEFANTAAYLTEFKKEGSDHKYIEFQGGPADVSQILKDLNDGGGGTVFDRGDGDYSRPPPDGQKTAAAKGPGMDPKLASAFEVQEEPLPYENPLQDSMELRDKLAKAYDDVTSELTGLETVHLDIGDRLFNEVKQASLSGVPLGHVVQAWGEVIEDPAFIKSAFALITPRLVENGVFPSREAMSNSLEKTAGVGMLNMDHPLVTEFSDYCEVIVKMAGMRQAQAELGDALDTMNTFTKQAAMKLGQGGLIGGAIGAIPKVLAAARKASEPAGKAGRVVGKVLYGDKGGEIGEKLLGGAVRYSPHILGALAAEEAYQQSKYNPVVQTVKNWALSRVPYTGPWRVRQAQLAAGAGY